MYIQRFHVLSPTIFLSSSSFFHFFLLLFSLSSSLFFSSFFPPSFFPFILTFPPSCLNFPFVLSFFLFSFHSFCPILRLHFFSISAGYEVRSILSRLGKFSSQPCGSFRLCRGETKTRKSGIRNKKKNKKKKKRG